MRTFLRVLLFKVALKYVLYPLYRLVLLILGSYKVRNLLITHSPGIESMKCTLIVQSEKPANNPLSRDREYEMYADRTK